MTVVNPSQARRKSILAVMVSVACGEDPRPPEAVGAIADQEVFKGEAKYVDPARYFTDPNGDVLTFDVAAAHLPTAGRPRAEIFDGAGVRHPSRPCCARPALPLRPGGHVLGYLETPSGLRIFEIGEDYILGRVWDELGVESVRVWPLERS